MFLILKFNSIHVICSGYHFAMRNWFFDRAMTPCIEMNSNIHKYIFDKQHDEIFREYHDIVAGWAFSLTTFGEIVLPPWPMLTKILHYLYSFVIEKGKNFFNIRNNFFYFPIQPEITTYLLSWLIRWFITKMAKSSFAHLN